MLSKPLANPSTLDRRPAVAQLRDSPSYVEELWSPAPLLWMKNRMLKPTGNYRRFFLRSSTEGPFSLRRGLEPVLVFSR